MTAHRIASHKEWIAERKKLLLAEKRFTRLRDWFAEREGLSVFTKSGKGAVYHTYSTYARGIDMVNLAYQYLDLVPKGRDEGGQGLY